MGGNSIHDGLMAVAGDLAGMHQAVVRLRTHIGELAARRGISPAIRTDWEMPCFLGHDPLALAAALQRWVARQHAELRHIAELAERLGVDGEEAAAPAPALRGALVDAEG